jgi:hypothetical protein
MPYKDKQKDKKWHKEDYQRKKEIYRELHRKWCRKNREKKRLYDKKPNAKIKRRLRNRERRKIDPKFRLDSNIGSDVCEVLKGRKVWRKWEALVGYTIEDLMEHLEEQFDDNMSWDNYGSYWWIDHIKPVSKFNYKEPEEKEFKECWSLNNLQPLEKIINIKKSNKV